MFNNISSHSIYHIVFILTSVHFGVIIHYYQIDSLVLNNKPVAKVIKNIEMEKYWHLFTLPTYLVLIF